MSWSGLALTNLRAEYDQVARGKERMPHKAETVARLVVELIDEINKAREQSGIQRERADTAFAVERERANRIADARIDAALTEIVNAGNRHMSQFVRQRKTGELYQEAKP